MKEISQSDIDFSSPIKIFSLSWLRDGGSVILHCGNASGQEFKLEFYQHMMLLMDKYRLFPGRIHLNNELVKDYSDLEESIIQGLKVASFEFVYTKKEDQQMDQKILAEKLAYVRSASYSLNNQKVRDHMREKGMN
ncbi:MAG: hypothetical protein AAGD28_23625 [Bacteroidota bacterium]